MRSAPRCSGRRGRRAGWRARIRAGAVTINDLIVPTADPRLPFGGRGQSGFGVTRGAEGLLELTRLKTVSLRRGRLRPHYQPATAAGPALFSDYLRAAHGPGRIGRIRAWFGLCAALGRRARAGSGTLTDGRKAGRQRR